ncbi:hypothetical protein [Gordonia oryzae]|nr:hypothetical protein [Gordonia oryzae]
MGLTRSPGRSDDPTRYAGETVTVEHQYGSATIPSDRAKVVTVVVT